MEARSTGRDARRAGRAPTPVSEIGEPWERAANRYEYRFSGRSRRMKPGRLVKKLRERGWDEVPAGAGFDGDGYTFRRLKDRSQA
jgi:hypothetical protein